jgi:hypothetical protein
VERNVEDVGNRYVFGAKLRTTKICRNFQTGAIDNRCSDFQKLAKSDRTDTDLNMLDVARAKKWIRCPGCKMLVEKQYGCNSIICSRCRTSFCYACGGKVSWFHQCRRRS